MNILLVGYGKMGKRIHELAVQQGHIVSIVKNSHELKAFSDAVDVAIEFTRPSAVMENIEMLCKKQIPCVIGTTGWYDEMNEVRIMIKTAGIGCIYASNFSIGVHVFWKMVKEASVLINQHPLYDVFGHEFHHKDKKDSPSGTARTTAEILSENIDRKTCIQYEALNDRPPLENELHFSSTRGGAIFGTHSVYFDSLVDQIEITHTAKNRDGFALGALQAAEWIQGKKGLFEVRDMLDGV
jgi:4-hydroxy-tetrahydrodipicolinate reductase